MTDRLSSGHVRLDEILHGGIFKNSITLVVGVPGSGKTILCQQFVFHNATIDKPALYLSTVTEPFDKILRYSQSLDFFDAAAVRERRVIYEDLGHARQPEVLQPDLLRGAWRPCRGRQGGPAQLGPPGRDEIRR